MIVARRYHFCATHHIPELPGYDQPHEHDYTVEIEAVSDLHDYFDTAHIDDWWVKQPQHAGADLNTIYQQTTVEWIATTLLLEAREEIGNAILAVTVTEDDERWGRAKA